jgi:hypothetical protein
MLVLVSCLLPCTMASWVAAQPRQVGGAGITVFGDRDFKGESANFRSDVSDLTKYRMNDMIASIRVGPGETWQVCVDKNYKGRCQTFSGSQGDLSRIGWSAVISSMRRVRNAGPIGGDRPAFGNNRGQITFYDRPNYQGRSRTLTDAADTLGFFSNRAGSIRVDGGAWEVCDGAGFRGRCLTINRNVPDLSRFGLDGQTSSARPRR